MWSTIAERLSIPWRAVEDMHWTLGKGDLARRARVKPFSAKTVVREGSQGDQYSPQRALMPPPGQAAHGRELNTAHHQELHTMPPSMDTAHVELPWQAQHSAGSPLPLPEPAPPQPHQRAEPPAQPSTASPMANIESEFNAPTSVL